LNAGKQLTITIMKSNSTSPRNVVPRRHFPISAASKSVAELQARQAKDDQRPARRQFILSPFAGSANLEGSFETGTDTLDCI
jgi:hypothetical protein